MLLNWKKKLFLDDDYQKYANILRYGRDYIVAPKEQKPQKLSGKRTVRINSGKRQILAEGAKISQAPRQRGLES